MILFFVDSVAQSNDEEESDEYEEESSNMDESLQNGPATLGCLTVKGNIYIELFDLSMHNFSCTITFVC